MPSDLHMHTTYSDGKLTPEELVATAKEAGLSYMAITDHDTVEGISHLYENGLYPARGIHIIPGIEFSAHHPTREIHILGYNIDIYYGELVDKLNDVTEARWTRFSEMVEKLQNLGYEISETEVLTIAGTSRSISRSHIGRVLVKKGYFPVPPIDHTQDLRDDMVANLQKVGLILERSHHEVAGAGQQEINYRFNSLQHAGDDLMKYKYVVHETAALAGKAATFMPKPIAGDNGTGMHCHQSLWKDGKPLFYDEKNYGGLSDLARWYIGGLIKHSSSVLAFTNPSLNSYHRLVPGFEAPVNLVYSARNRSAAIRIPLAGTSPAAKRIEFRAPDPSCNPFLAFSAQLMAGLDGILNHIEPPAPVDKDLYELPPEEHAGIKQVPSSLAEAMDALEEDHDFLTAGDVFTDDLIDTWISIKRGEIDQARLAPTPLEYELYFHI